MQNNVKESETYFMILILKICIKQKSLMSTLL